MQTILRSLHRLVASGVFAVSLLPLSAQTTASSSANTEENEKGALRLDPFEVISTQDKGYNAAYSGNALKTNEEIMKVPQSITVITRDMIKDIASYDLSDILNYVGVGNFQQGESAYVRGQGVGITTDGATDGASDPVTLDSITIIRGPVSVLYGGQASLTGAVSKQTRRPLSTQKGSLTLQADQYGFWRTELDSTGPIGKAGGAEFTYRFDYASQGGKNFLRNYRQDRTTYFGVVQMKYHDTTLRIGGQFEDETKFPHKNIFLKPDGLPWISSGRDEGFLDRDSNINKRTSVVRLVWEQRFSPGWASNIYAVGSRSQYGPHSVILADRVDYANQVYRMYARRNNQEEDVYTLGGDLTGKYTVLKRALQTSMGFYVRNLNRPHSDFVSSSNFGDLNRNNPYIIPAKSSATATSFDRIDIPLASLRQAFDFGIYNPPANTYSFTPTQSLGTKQDTTETNVYLQQNLEIIPNRLFVVASASQINNYQVTHPYTFVQTTVNTSNGTENRNNRLLHRYGLVLNVTKNLALYVLDTTNVVFLNSSSRLEDGSFIPPRDGQLRELGLKTTLLDNKITATTSIYDNHYKNYAVSRTGTIDPVLGYQIFDLSADNYIKGFDFSLFLKPLPKWQISVNYTHQDPKINRTQARLSASFISSYGIMSTYQFSSGFLSRFTLGGGLNETHGKITSATTMILPNGVQASTTNPSGALPVRDGTMMMLFVNYQISKRFELRAKVNNVLDEVFAVGAQHTASIDVTQPRNVMLQGTMRF